ncbi:MAG: hypothetical protein IKA07_05905 [Alistipes sp.]|nr:hypothetical protein [Alistipes sp.]
MSEITTTPTAQLTKAQNIQDVEVALQQIAETANESLAAALNAQIQVLKYVQSPKLYDSSFDLLFANVRKAIKMTDSTKERELIREKTTVMINNYVFFMQAKIDYDTAVQRSEYESLMEEAILTLGESVADVAVAATTAGTGTAAKVTAKATMKKAVVNSLMKEQAKGKDGLLLKFMRWWNKESALRQKQEEFIETIYSLIGKLAKHKKLIGKSDIIAGLIERYADDITDHYTQDEWASVVYQQKENAKQLKVSSTASVFGTMVIAFFIWIWRVFSNAGTSVGNWFRKAENEVALTNYSSDIYLYLLGILAILLLIYFIRYWNSNRYISRLRQEASSKEEGIRNKLLTTAQAFEEGDEDYE